MHTQCTGPGWQVAGAQGGHHSGGELPRALLCLGRNTFGQHTDTSTMHLKGRIVLLGLWGWGLNGHLQLARITCAYGIYAAQADGVGTVRIGTQARLLCFKTEKRGKKGKNRETTGEKGGEKRKRMVSAMQGQLCCTLTPWHPGTLDTICRCQPLFPLMSVKRPFSK